MTELRDIINDMKYSDLESRTAALMADETLGHVNELTWRMEDGKIQAEMLIGDKSDPQYHEETIQDDAATYELLGRLSDIQWLEEQRTQYEAETYLDSAIKNPQQAFDELLQDELSDAVKQYLHDKIGEHELAAGNGTDVIDQYVTSNTDLGETPGYEIGKLSFMLDDMYDSLTGEMKQTFGHVYNVHKAERVQNDHGDYTAIDAKNLNRLADQTGRGNFRYIFEENDDSPGKQFVGIAAHDSTGYTWA